MRRSNKSAAKRGFTLIELLVVVAIIALLISILLPSLARARELSKRTVCASNISGIGKGFATYAAGNRDAWPIPGHNLQSDADFTAGVTTSAAGSGPGTAYCEKIGFFRGLGTATTQDPSNGETYPKHRYYNGSAYVEFAGDTQMSTTRAFWFAMVRNGAASPKSFICPSASNDQANPEDNPQAYWDFGIGDHAAPTDKASRIGSSGTPAFTEAMSKDGWTQCSYGYQVPFGKMGQPHPDNDQDMAMVADKGPFGAIIEGNLPAPSMPGGISYYFDDSGVSDVQKPTSVSSPDDWQKWNSPNHGGLGTGEGQNVMYPDGHADWVSNPLAGVAKDNIYTAWSTRTAVNLNERVQGRIIKSSTLNLCPWGRTDSLIYP